MISEALYNFLKDWLRWAEAGAKKHRYFSPFFGLCYNYAVWQSNGRGRRNADAYQQLSDIFEYDGLDTLYPFFDGRLRKTDNPARLAWVRAKIEQYEAAQTFTPEDADPGSRNFQWDQP